MGRVIRLRTVLLQCDHDARLRPPKQLGRGNVLACRLLAALLLQLQRLQRSSPLTPHPFERAARAY